MQPPRTPRMPWAAVTVALALSALAPSCAAAACCYFAAKDKDVLQPAQKAFITWDPAEKVESFTVQPKFEGNALDFGMVIPTPGRPRLDEMPRDFFKELAVYTILKKREYPQSKLLPVPPRKPAPVTEPAPPAKDPGQGRPRPTTVKVLEAGVVGSLDYKIITAERADDLFGWLKENKYHYSGDEATLDFYVKKGWVFTVMKIDTVQMKKNADGSFLGEVTPTRFQFPSDKLVYPLKITAISVKDHTKALFYVQAPYKVDLPGEMTYQYQWVPMLQNAQGWYAKGLFGTHDLPGMADDWLRDAKDHIPALLQKGQQLGFQYVYGQRPTPNQQGRTATTLEWARELTAEDVKLLKGQVAYTEKVPDPDEGFTQDDLKDPKNAEKVYKAIQERLEKYRKERPGGFLVREAPEKDVQGLKILSGHLKEKQFVTKVRKTFTKGEMDVDLEIVPAKLGGAEDHSEYEEVLPTSPP